MPASSPDKPEVVEPSVTQVTEKETATPNQGPTTTDKVSRQGPRRPFFNNKWRSKKQEMVNLLNYMLENASEGEEEEESIEDEEDNETEMEEANQEATE